MRSSSTLRRRRSSAPGTTGSPPRRTSPARDVGARPRAPRSRRRRGGQRRGVPGHPARLSRYSYLVSLLPEQIVRDLELDVELALAADGVVHPRRPRREAPAACSSSTRRASATRESFRDADRRRTRSTTPGAPSTPTWRDSPRRSRRRCSSRCRARVRSGAQVDPAIWRDVVATPLGEVIERRFADDTVRGVVATDALIGTFAVAARPVAGPEPLLPLPPDRQRHRRVAGAGRRHGRGHRRAGRGAPSTRAPRSSPAPASARSGPSDDGAEVTWHDGAPAAHRAGTARAGQRRAVGAADPARASRTTRDQARRARS